MKKDFSPLAVGNITFAKTELRLGQSHGNHFHIVLRDVQVDNEGDIEESFKQVRENGFINYFGSQRFGNGSVRTDRIGRLILQGDWNAAVEQILSPKLRDMNSPHGSFNNMIIKWQETRDSAGIYDKFFWKHSNEGIILRELSKDPKNYKTPSSLFPETIDTCMSMHIRVALFIGLFQREFGSIAVVSCLVICFLLRKQ